LALGLCIFLFVLPTACDLLAPSKAKDQKPKTKNHLVK
jgi:hypothetical protein